MKIFQKFQALTLILVAVSLWWTPFDQTLTMVVATIILLANAIVEGIF